MLRFPKAQGLASARNVIKTLINTSRSYDYCWMYQFDFDSQCCLLSSHNFSKFSHALRHAANKWILLWKQVTIGAWLLPDNRSALLWSLETVRAFFLATVCWLGCFRSVTTLSVCTVENGWEGAGTTEQDHDSRCSLQGFEPEISRIPKWVFYHYNIRIVVTLCYSRSTNEVQRVTYVKQNVGE